MGRSDFYRLCIVLLLLWTAWNVWEVWSIYSLLYGNTDAAAMWRSYGDRLSAFYSRGQFVAMWSDPVQRLTFADTFYSSFEMARLETWFFVTAGASILLLLVRFLLPVAEENKN